MRKVSDRIFLKTQLMLQKNSFQCPSCFLPSTTFVATAPHLPFELVDIYLRNHSRASVICHTRGAVSPTQIHSRLWKHAYYTPVTLCLHGFLTLLGVIEGNGIYTLATPCPNVRLPLGQTAIPTKHTTRDKLILKKAKLELLPQS